MTLSRLDASLRVGSSLAAFTDRAADSAMALA
jgi:hypothetical protein